MIHNLSSSTISRHFLQNIGHHIWHIPNSSLCLLKSPAFHAAATQPPTPPTPSPLGSREAPVKRRQPAGGPSAWDSNPSLCGCGIDNKNLGRQKLSLQDSPAAGGLGPCASQQTHEGHGPHGPVQGSTSTCPTTPCQRTSQRQNQSEKPP